MELPLDDDLGQIDGQLPLLDGGVGCQPEALDGGDHVLHQVLTYRVVDSVVTTQQLTGRGRGKEVGLVIQYGREGCKDTSSHSSMSPSRWYVYI